MEEGPGEFVDAEVVRTKKQAIFMLILIDLSFLYYHLLLVELKQTLPATFFIPLVSGSLMLIPFKTVDALGGMCSLLSAAGKKAENI